MTLNVVAHEMPRSTDSADLLSIEDLRISVPSAAGRVDAVSGVSLVVKRGHAVGFVGESGSGKTLTCRAILGVLPPGCEVAAGRIEFDGDDLVGLDAAGWRKVHGAKIGAVFQDPASYLHPSLPVGRQLAEVLRTRTGLGRRAARRRAVELFAEIGLPHPSHVYHQIPSELSGGMLQRVMMAIAISLEPQLLVADEATTALDVVTQAEVLELLSVLRARFGISVLFVSHDLAVVAELCDTVVVFYAGQVVEVADRASIATRPRHPYTEALLRVGAARNRSGELETIPGQPPSLGEILPGCRFAPRCAFAEDRCRGSEIPLRSVGDGRFVRCVRAGELAFSGTVVRVD